MINLKVSILFVGFGAVPGPRWVFTVIAKTIEEAKLKMISEISFKHDNRHEESVFVDNAIKLLVKLNKDNLNDEVFVSQHSNHIGEITFLE